MKDLYIKTVHINENGKPQGHFAVGTDDGGEVIPARICFVNRDNRHILLINGYREISGAEMLPNTIPWDGRIDRRNAAGYSDAPYLLGRKTDGDAVVFDLVMPADLAGLDEIDNHVMVERYPNGFPRRYCHRHRAANMNGLVIEDELHETAAGLYELGMEFNHAVKSIPAVYFPFQMDTDDVRTAFGRAEEKLKEFEARLNYFKNLMSDDEDTFLAENGFPEGLVPCP